MFKCDKAYKQKYVYCDHGEKNSIVQEVHLKKKSYKDM